jgi:hypothetical protein
MAREAGVLARTGSILLAGTAGAGLPGRVTTIIVARDAFQLAGPSAERSLAASVARLCDAAGQRREITVSDEGLERWAECFTTIQAFEIWRGLGDWDSGRDPGLAPGSGSASLTPQRCRRTTPGGSAPSVPAWRSVSASACHQAPRSACRRHRAPRLFGTLLLMMPRLPSGHGRSHCCA